MMPVICSGITIGNETRTKISTNGQNHPFMQLKLIDNIHPSIAHIMEPLLIERILSQ